MLKLRVLNPKSVIVYTDAQLLAVKTFVDALPVSTRSASFGEIRAAVPQVATLTDGALHALLLAGGYVVAD